ncbi:MAG: ribonuclease Y [Propionibacteriaceae bacterium]
MPNRGGLSELDLLIIGLLIVAVIAAVVMAVLWARVLEKFRASKLSQSELDQRARDDRDDIRGEREAVVRRETLVAEREARATETSAAINERAARVDALEAEVRARSVDIDKAHDEAVRELERVAGLTRDEALAGIIERAEHDARLRAAAIARDIEQAARATAERQASSIVVTAMQRLATEQTAASVVVTVDLPSEDMKGRIIGREGRNIRAFEQVTGVNVLVDDTPGSVLLSSFDPVRRETARVALEELVADGRIHPQRIEEAFERSKATVDDRIDAVARDALAGMGISDLHPDLVPVVGALHYRTSHGQNVLAHVIECGHLAGMIAAELGLDAAFCRRAAFLHDIGKAVTHEHEGSHALVGGDLLRRHGEHADIVHAVEAHHNEVEPRTVEAVLVQVVDAISGSRPGARRESLEAYVHRLERLEELATAHAGVERAFAVQAGRDVRVMVSPTLVDDAQAAALARQIAQEISEELTFPGQIRVTVVRESRAIEIAS